MRTPPPPRDDLRFSNTTGILQKKEKKTVWFIGVEVEQETSAPPPKKILDPPLTCFGEVHYWRGRQWKQVAIMHHQSCQVICRTYSCNHV